ncbi:hypothetical protein LTR56_010883 [Elasticomyces elasticus]|nr:hypothetical protein LTR56_010883 [Elasticomyces elasticus]KAK3650244.1 hypothetical protein LTR22_012571 [Elasticomyces elasticus]KAK4911835.1 hypothetical protein LTR49_019635 [Elasticomyces elasticus]KAK5768263.1 hypothetical protein LTS12_001402 [Elasticomyces elasticus]
MTNFMLLLTWLCVTILAASIPFGMEGALQSATVSGEEYNAGGTLVVDGMTITIPKNLQVQFPATFASWRTTAAAGLTGYEVSVTGNIVEGKAIAAMVDIAQFLLQGGTGVIASVANTGLITLTTGQKLRINDPNGVFSAGYTARPLFTADDENPSITAFSGFPMCVPRSASDPKCPASNRPAGHTTFAAPDPLVMAPFVAGDYISYSGIDVSGETVVYSIVAESVIITTSGMPPYIRVEDAIIGVVDGQSTNVVEFADSRFIGYVSDGATQVTVSRMEVDHCTGEVNEVSVGVANPIAPRNKFTFRASSTTAGKYTREYIIRAGGSTKATNGGAITAGQYVQPVTEWILPEFDGGLIPEENDFTNFLHLRDGLGPDENNNLWGQLDPWPGATKPSAPSVCTAAPSPTDTGTGTAPTGSIVPIADAGTNQQVRPGSLVNLKASASNAASFPSGDLSFAWNQTAGPTVTLKNPTSATPSFQAPSSSADVTYTFKVTIKSASNPAADATLSSKSVNITSSRTNLDIVTIDSYTWDSRQGGTITVTAHSSVVDGSVTGMTLALLNPTAGAALVMTSQTGGKFTYSAKSTKQPSNGITVTSNFGGKAAKTTLTARRRRRWASVM